MNQVGKYAAGGVVTPNRHTYGNGVPGSLAAFRANPAGGAAPALQKLAGSATKASTAVVETADKSAKFNGAIFGAQLVLSSLTPTIDETSSTFEKFTAMGLGGLNTFLSTLMIVNGILGAFGTELTIANAQLALQNAGNFLSNLTSFVARGGGSMGRTVARGAMGATRATAGALQSVGLKGFGKALLSAEKGIARFAVGSARLATGIGAVTLVTEGLTMALGYFLDNTKAINAAIEAGDVGQAGVEARTQQNTQNTISAIGGGASGAGIGAVIGTMIAPGIGTAIGAAFGGTFGALNAWANGLEESTITQAEAAAGVVRANNEMAESASKSF